MKALTLGTKNRDKLRELQEILAGEALRLEVLPPGVPEHPEEAATLLENAVGKARSYARAVAGWCLADDTGLEVDALDGAPGVRTARFAGPGASYADNRRALLAALSGVPSARRGARFRTVVAIADPRGEVLATAVGELAGRIALAEAGAGGFGYDSIFLPEGRERTLAELSADEKHALSHRARALSALRPRLLELC